MSTTHLKYVVKFILIAAITLLTINIRPGQAGRLSLHPGRSANPSLDSMTTAISYQGRLDKDSRPYDGICDFQFSLWDAVTDGSPAGPTISLDDFPVNNGLFTVSLDFGAGAFNGDRRWLEISAQCSGDSTHTIFTRQEMNATPYAIFALSAPWDGITNRPSGLDDGDDDTQYSAGDGLVLNTNQFTIDTAEIQRRVSGTCHVGSTIRSISEDGSVVCQPDNPFNRALAPSDPTVTTLASSGNTGLHTSITIAPDGLGMISFLDLTTSDLMLADCQNLECTSANFYDLDSTGNVGWYTSIIIGTDGLGLLSYMDSTNHTLKTAHCNNPECSSATTAVVDSNPYTGYYSSIAIGTDGLGLIAYSDMSTKDLKVAHCDDPICSYASLTTLDSAGELGTNTSITIGSDGKGLISYSDWTNKTLKVAHCNTISCSAATITTIDSNNSSFGVSTSITTGADGLGLISYLDALNQTVKMAHCSNLECTSSTISTIDSVNTTGGYYPSLSLTIGGDGLGLLVYYDDNTETLRSAHCQDDSCSSTSISILDTNVSNRDYFYGSVTIGVDSLPLISYHDYINHDLKVIHCSNAFCLANFRRR